MIGDAPAGPDLVALLETLADRADGRDGERFARIADLARSLAGELSALRPEAVEAVARAHQAILGALHDAHQPVREVVLFERVRERGADLAPEDFQAIVEDLVARGQIRVAVDHEGPARDPAPFEPRFYRPRG
jgi:hypothetical protein